MKQTPRDWFDTVVFYVLLLGSLGMTFYAMYYYEQPENRKESHEVCLIPPPAAMALCAFHAELQGSARDTK